MQKRTILQIANLTPKADKRLRELFQVISLDELANFQDQVEALVTTGGVKVSAQLMDKFPSLKLIATRGVGFDHIDIKNACEKNIVVTNTPDVLSDCVADLAFGGLIAISRELVNADKFVRSGKWKSGKYPLTTKVSQKRLGIVGMGRIGKAIAKRAEGFDMQIRYFSRTPKTELTYIYESSLEELCSWADYLILCAPGGEATSKMISKQMLKALGSKGYLVNIARGTLLDEVALIEALKSRSIAGALLDVFTNEPNVPEAFLELENVILLPHIASSTQETFDAMENLLIENLENYFTNGVAITPVKG